MATEHSLRKNQPEEASLFFTSKTRMDREEN
jgi:hypothetical protein